MKPLILISALLLGACAAAKPGDFSPIQGGPPPAPREAAYSMCAPQAELAGQQAGMVQQSMNGGVVAVGQPAFVAGAVVGHAIGSAIAIGLARTNARDRVLEACMAQAGYVKTPK